MLENLFPDILEELLNCDHQRYASVHNQGQSIPASSSELNTSLSHGVRDGGQTQRAPRHGFPHMKTRGQAQCCGSFCHSTPEIPYNHHHNCQIINPTFYTAHSSRHMSHTLTVRPINEPCNHYGFADRTAL